MGLGVSPESSTEASHMLGPGDVWPVGVSGPRPHLSRACNEPGGHDGLLGQDRTQAFGNHRGPPFLRCYSGQKAGEEHGRTRPNGQVKRGRLGF